MLRIFKLCDEFNVEFNVRRSSAKWTSDDERWSASFEGYNESDKTQIRSEGMGATADAAIVQGWERFSRVASGGVPSLKAIAKG